MRPKNIHWVLALTVALSLHASLLFIYKSPPSGAQSLGIGGIQASVVQLKSVKQGSELAAQKRSSKKTTTSENIKSSDQPKLSPPPEPRRNVVKEVQKNNSNKPLIAIEKSVVKQEVEKKSPLPPVKTPQLPEIKPVNETKVARIERLNNTESTEESISPSLNQNDSVPTNNEQAKLDDSIDQVQGSQSPSGVSQVNSQGGASIVAKADYQTILRTILEQNKRYPANARKRRQEGVVRLWFKVNKQGKLLEYKIASSSGYRMLDKEVEKLIQRVSPLPKIPDAINRNEIEVNVPIAFKIK